MTLMIFANFPPGNYVIIVFCISLKSSASPDSLHCKVCGSAYQVEQGTRLDWQHGFTTQHWLQTAAIVTCMCVSAAGAWVTIQLFEDPVIRMLSAGSALLIQYVCVR